MKVQECSVNIRRNSENTVPKQSPAFKSVGAGALGFAGTLMQGIENQGFWLTFIIQDLMGMTAPRVWTGFQRDKDITGRYNIQEGFEVLGREGMTGPCMIAVAPIGLAIAALFGKSTGINSKLIKRFGNNLKELICKPEFKKDLLNNKEQFKKEFYQQNIKKILNDSLGKQNVKDESITYILEEIAKFEKIPEGAELKGLFGKSKYRNERMANIQKHIDNIRYTSSDKLDQLQKLTVNGSEFSISNTIEAMIKYTDDAITANKYLNNMDAQMAENIKNSSVAKRFITNIALMASTLGVLSILPKIYAKSKVPPSAQTVEIMRQKKAEEKAKAEHESNNEVTFKGKGGNSASVMSKFGEFLSKILGDKFATHMEYNGHNFTPTLMAGLSIFGLLGPRGLHAVKRAPKNEETGKKDLSELWEICIRDLTSSLSVVFLVPMATRALVTSYEDKTGFVLMHKERNKSKLNTVLDLFNPYSKAHVMTNAEIEALYNNVDSKAKMINFCNFIEKNNGDLQKILAKSETVGEVFADKLNMKELAALPKAEKNKKIIELINELGNGDKAKADELVAKLMKNVSNKKGNKIASFARGLNSVPGFLVTFFVSPIVLGWFIPRLTYANTRRLHEKAEKEKAENSKINTAA